MYDIIEKSKCRDVAIVDVIRYPYKINLICVLFGTAIPTSSSNVFLYLSKGLSCIIYTYCHSRNVILGNITSSLLHIVTSA